MTPITQELAVRRSPETGRWHFDLLDDNGDVLETSCEFPTRHGALRGAMLLERSGKMTSPPARLTEEQVLEIRHSLDTGVDLAERYGISTALVSMIRNRRRYRWLRD